MTPELALEHLQRRIGYEFRDAARLRLALTHRSAGAAHNERLEFLGDAVLGFEVSHRLFARHPEATEGQLTRMRAQLVKRETLAEVARAIALGDYLILGPGELRSGGQSRDSTLADALEAVIAAVYLDGGLEAARALINHLIGERLEALTPKAQRKDPKTRLQEYLQARQQGLPLYAVTAVSGHQHNQTFTVRCEIETLGMHTEGSGGSRRKAEQVAAARMLASLGEA